MLTTVLASLAIGAALGLRFRIYIVLPAMAVASAVVAAQAHGHGALATLGEWIAVSVLMQLGYLVGVVSSPLLHDLLLQLTDPCADARARAHDAQR